MEKKATLTISQRIKKRRISLGLSYQRLADKTGMSKSTLQRYEVGNTNYLSADNLSLLATALETTPSYLMDWSEIECHTPVNVEKEKLKEKFIKLIRKRKALFDKCGFSIDTLTDEEIEELSGDLLHHINLLSFKYKKE